MEQQTLLTRNQASRLSGISGKCFNYLIQQEPFLSYLVKEKKNQWVVNPEVIPLIQEYYNTHNAAYHYYNAHPDYLPVYHAAKMLNMTYRELVEEIQSGKWEGKYVAVPKCAPPPAELLVIKENYFLIRSEFMENKYHTLEQIAKNTTLISPRQLYEYRRMGLVPQPTHLVGTNLYDEKEILNLLPSLKLERKEHFAEQIGNSLQNAFDLLNPKQQQIISKYLRFRANGGVVNYKGYRSKQSIANKEVTLEFMKRTISSVFVLIISGRCGIEEDFHKNPLHKNQTPEAFEPDIFDIYSICQDDYFYLYTKRKGKTLINYYHQLRTFYFYLLDELKDDALYDKEEFWKFSLIERKIEKFLNQFPIKQGELNKADINKKTKTFLTREQMVLIKQYLLEDVRARDPIKHATMWQFSCSTGVRPEELHKIQINHFRFDSKGLIHVHENGWGILMLPADISKQGNSPSHPDYHTPIPPDTVKQLNQYLSIVYNRQGSIHPKGKGYLFRPDYALPEHHYMKPIHFGFINRIRNRLDFLDDARKQDFIFKASRHSLNNTIMKSHIRTDASLNDYAKKIAADHQLRHKPSRSVGEEYYLDEISEKEYYQVLDATINFPWHIEKLTQWELDMGYRIATVPTDSAYEENNEYDEDRKELRQQLLKLEEQLQETREKPKNLTEQQWIAKRQMLIETKKMITHRLKGE